MFGSSPFLNRVQRRIHAAIKTWLSCARRVRGWRSRVAPLNQPRIEAAGAYLPSLCSPSLPRLLPPPAATMSGKGAKGLSGKGAKGTIGIKGAGDKKKPISRSARAGASCLAALHSSHLRCHVPARYTADPPE